MLLKVPVICHPIVSLGMRAAVSGSLSCVDTKLEACAHNYEAEWSAGRSDVCRCRATSVFRPVVPSAAIFKNSIIHVLFLYLK